jgi:hypothetical protein
VTAHADPSGVEGMEVLHKPFDFGAFLDQVRRLLPGAPRAGTPGGDVDAAIELVLYVTPGTPASSRARQNLDQVLATLDPAGVSVSICDLTQQPLRAEADGVVFSPTLVKRRPAPRTWLQGDLSNTAMLREVLLLSGATAVSGR